MRDHKARTVENVSYVSLFRRHLLARKLVRARAVSMLYPEHERHLITTFESVSNVERQVTNRAHVPSWRWQQGRPGGVGVREGGFGSSHCGGGTMMDAGLAPASLLREEWLSGLRKP